MISATVSKEIKKVNAQIALIILKSYVNEVLEPYYNAKMDKLPDRQRSLRVAGLWEDRINRARNALLDLESEIASMPD